MSVPNASIIIPAGAGVQWDGLRRCLLAAARQRYEGEYEVVLVDNHPLPTLPRELGFDADRPDAFERLRVIHEPNRGAYHARNAGAASSRAQVLAFTDADAVVRSDWLQRGVEALGQGADQVVAGAIEVTAEGRPNAIELFEQRVAFRQGETVSSSGFGVTANLFVRREDFRRVGPFLGQLRSGGDHEWAQRAKAAGLSFHFAPGAQAQHPARRTLWELLAKARRVGGGQADLQRLGASLRHLGPRRTLVGAFLPPARAAARFARDRSLTPLQRAQLVGVAFAQTYAQAWARARPRVLPWAIDAPPG